LQAPKRAFFPSAQANCAGMTDRKELEQMKGEGCNGMILCHPSAIVPSRPVSSLSRVTNGKGMERTHACTQRTALIGTLPLPGRLRGPFPRVFPVGSNLGQRAARRGLFSADGPGRRRLVVVGRPFRPGLSQLPAADACVGSHVLPPPRYHGKLANSGLVQNRVTKTASATRQVEVF